MKTFTEGMLSLGMQLFPRSLVQPATVPGITKLEQRGAFDKGVFQPSLPETVGSKAYHSRLLATEIPLSSLLDYGTTSHQIGSSIGWHFTFSFQD
jgi:hypothetical protein